MNIFESESKKFLRIALGAILICTIVLILILNVSALRTGHTVSHSLKTNAYSSVLLMLSGFLCLIYRNSLKKSLARAEQSERELQEKNDSLEQIIEERTRELRKNQTEQITQLYRFAEFGRMSSGIFHDMINPFSAVTMNIYSLQKSSAENHEHVKASIDRAVQASRRLERFITSVKRQISATDTKENFSMNDLVEETMEIFNHKALKSGVALEFQSDEEIRLYGNTIKFQQIVSNLISNAIDSYEGADKSASERCVKIKIHDNASHVCIRVSDSGCGIPQDNIGKIFDPFFTTKSYEKGIGIGLSTIKEIIESEFKGRISVTSKESVGSTFRVKIPSK